MPWLRGGFQPLNGLAIEVSRARGLYDAADEVEKLICPPVLAKALAAAPEAAEYFMQTKPSNRRNVLRWLFKAKGEVTREGRIGQIITKSKAGERIAQM